MSEPTCGYIKVGSLAINDTDKENSYQVFIRFEGLKVQIADEDKLSLSLENQLIEITYFKTEDILLQPRGNSTGLLVPHQSVLDLRGSTDKLSRLVGFAVEGLKDKNGNPAKKVYFKKCV